jgi:ubiquinone/menaquinone biosynthesis C-methylase UbiE
MTDLSEKYFLLIAAAFVRGRSGAAACSEVDELSNTELTSLVQQGLDSGLKIHKFKKTMGLARVSKILGVLRGLQPESLLDVGSGRGAFLWPLLDQFRYLPVTCVDLRADRVADIEAVRTGGISNVRALRMDAENLDLQDEAFDVVTMLEVLEHMPNPERAIGEALRVSRRAVLLSVPSHEDDNPEHIHVLGRKELEKMIAASGFKVSFDQVLNHLLAVISKVSKAK